MPTTRGRSAVAWRWGWDGAPRLRERRPGPQRWASPATHTQLAGRGPGGRAAELLLDRGESPAPPASPPSTRQRRARSLQPGMALQSLSEPRQDAAGPVSVPSRDRQRRGVRAGSSLHLSQENWAQPERQTQSQCCCPPVGWLSPKHEEQTPRGCGARGAAGRAGAGAVGVPLPRARRERVHVVTSTFPLLYRNFFYAFKKAARRQPPTLPPYTHPPPARSPPHAAPQRTPTSSGLGVGQRLSRPDSLLRQLHEAGSEGHTLARGPRAGRLLTAPHLVLSSGQASQVPASCGPEQGGHTPQGWPGVRRSPPPTSLILVEDDQERTSNRDSEGRAGTKAQREGQDRARRPRHPRRLGGNPPCSRPLLEKRPGRGVPATRQARTAQVQVGEGTSWPVGDAGWPVAGQLWQEEQAAGSETTEPLLMLSQMGSRAPSLERGTWSHEP